MITYIVVLIVQGAIVGALARLALPGRDPMSPLATIAIGLAGSFVGGIAVYAAGGRGGAPFLTALVVSVAIVYLIRRRRGGGLASPGAGDDARPARSQRR